MLFISRFITRTVFMNVILYQKLSGKWGENTKKALIRFTSN